MAAIPSPPAPGRPGRRTDFVAGLLVGAVALLTLLIASDLVRPPPASQAAIPLPVNRAATRPTPTAVRAAVQPEPDASFDEPSSLQIGIAPVSTLATTAWHRAVARSGPAGEWPIFADLRASRGQPIPPEVAALAREITRDCKTNAERARALYDWLTSHITYDWKVWADIVAGAGTYTEPQDPLSVIRRGTAVCAGYAWLYDAFASSVGLDATFVIGDVRGYRGTPDDELISKVKHAWNCVNIDGAWTLLDATWGARQPGEATEDYVSRRDYYFATPAAQLIFDHLPESPAWQLLADPISDDAFHTLPNLKPAFFTSNLRLGQPFCDTLTATADQPSGVTLAAPDEIAVTATLSSTNGVYTQNKLLFRGDATNRVVLIAPLPTGDYLLRLYARCVTNASRYACCADFAVSVAPADPSDQ